MLTTADFFLVPVPTFLIFTHSTNGHLQEKRFEGKVVVRRRSGESYFQASSLLS